MSAVCYGPQRPTEPLSWRHRGDATLQMEDNSGPYMLGGDVQLAVDEDC